MGISIRYSYLCELARVLLVPVRLWIRIVQTSTEPQKVAGEAVPVSCEQPPTPYPTPPPPPSLLHEWRVNHGSGGISYAIFCTSPRWSALTVWPQGVLVRHGKLLYRALGIHNVAIPGDSHHGRFFVSIIADFCGKWYSISADLPCVLRFMV